MKNHLSSLGATLFLGVCQSSTPIEQPSGSTASLAASSDMSVASSDIATDKLQQRAKDGYSLRAIQNTGSTAKHAAL